MEVPENAESSAPRVKKKIKHKRMWDEPEAQASEVQNATSKRPDRIKTRRRLVPSSSTARALRTPVVVLQEDPYYDFGKKIKHTSSSTAGLNVLDLETRTSVKSPVVASSTEEDDSRSAEAADAVPDRTAAAERSNVALLRTRTQLSRNPYNSTSNGAIRRPENPTECVYPPRYVRRNKTRPERDTRCLPAEPETRTTRTLQSTAVVTSVSVRGNQKRNDTAADDQQPVSSPTTVAGTTATVSDIGAEPTSAANPVTHPKHLRSRYRNISLPEYLEITKVNQRRTNGSGVSVTPESVRPGALSTEPTSNLTPTVVRSTGSTGSTVGSTAAVSSSSYYPSTSAADDAETADVAPTTTTGERPSRTDAPTTAPTDLQDFIYLNNGTSSPEPPPIEDVVGAANGTATATVYGGNGMAAEAIEARQRRPTAQRNLTRSSAAVEHDVGVVYPEGVAASTYLLTFLAIVPLVLVIAFAFKLAVRRNRKKVFDSSEYSSEYNRSPLDFNTITSSPITTKLPRVPQHIVWDAEKSASAAPAPTSQPPAVPPPNSGRWEFPREKLRLQTILGQGNFGQVWKAEADDISGHEGLTRLVAVKMVKEDAASREREDLIRELSIMQHLGSHPNVVTLLGCCTEKGKRTRRSAVYRVYTARVYTHTFFYRFFLRVKTVEPYIIIAIVIVIIIVS